MSDFVFILVCTKLYLLRNFQLIMSLKYLYIDTLKKLYNSGVSVQAVIYLRLYSNLNFSCYKNRIWLLSHFIIVENIHNVTLTSQSGDSQDPSEKPASTLGSDFTFQYWGKQENKWT